MISVKDPFSIDFPLEKPPSFVNIRASIYIETGEWQKIIIEN